MDKLNAWSVLVIMKNPSDVSGVKIIFLLFLELKEACNLSLCFHLPMLLRSQIYDVIES